MQTTTKKTKIDGYQLSSSGSIGSKVNKLGANLKATIAAVIQPLIDKVSRINPRK